MSFRISKLNQPSMNIGGSGHIIRHPAWGEFKCPHCDFTGLRNSPQQKICSAESCHQKQRAMNHQKALERRASKSGKTVSEALSKTMCAVERVS